MDRIEAAILRTVLYADLFNFPMTPREVHHFLIHDEPVDLPAIQHTLATSPTLRGLLDQVDGCVLYKGRQEILTTRQARGAASDQLWPLALKYGVWLARLPFVRMVALTGALSMHNAASVNDDLDYILVTAPRRVWLARAFSILLVRLGRLQGVEICPNYVLAESALAQDKRDIFMAHEVAQMAPIYGHDLYRRFRAANAWVSDQLPNADGAFYQADEPSQSGVWWMLKRGLEMLLGGGLGDWLEGWEYRRKLRRFAGEMQKPHSSAKLDDQHVKGHFNDHGHPVLQRYAQLLAEYDLEIKTPAAVPGD